MPKKMTTKEEIILHVTRLDGSIDILKKMIDKISNLSEAQKNLQENQVTEFRRNIHKYLTQHIDQSTEEQLDNILNSEIIIKYCSCEPLLTTVKKRFAHLIIVTINRFFDSAKKYFECSKNAPDQKESCSKLFTADQKILMNYLFSILSADTKKLGQIIKLESCSMENVVALITKEIEIDAPKYYCGKKSWSFGVKNIRNPIAFLYGQLLADDYEFEPFDADKYQNNQNSDLFPLIKRDLRIAAKLRYIITKFLPTYSEFLPVRHLLIVLNKGEAWMAPHLIQKSNNLLCKVHATNDILYGFITKLLVDPTQKSPRVFIRLAHHDPIIRLSLMTKRLESLWSSIIPYTYNNKNYPDYKLQPPSQQHPFSFMQGHFYMQKTLFDKDNAARYRALAVKQNHLDGICISIKSLYFDFYTAREEIACLTETNDRLSRNRRDLQIFQKNIRRHIINKTITSDLIVKIEKYLHNFIPQPTTSDYLNKADSIKYAAFLHNLINDIRYQLFINIKSSEEKIKQNAATINDVLEKMLNLANRAVKHHGSLGLLVRALLYYELGNVYYYGDDRNTAFAFFRLAFIDMRNALKMAAPSKDLLHNTFLELNTFTHFGNKFPATNMGIEKTFDMDSFYFRLEELISMTEKTERVVRPRYPKQ